MYAASRPVCSSIQIPENRASPVTDRWQCYTRQSHVCRTTLRIMRWTLLLYLPLTLSLPAAVQAETEPADDDSFSSWAYDVFVDGASVRLGLGVQQAGI